ncbi:unnamed protein product [Rotaria magnacalcarata]|uniref:Uncharacterized protein n=1 Tax=Rotaria magnacalcarata TaxID=392030 RepID=A0A8S3AD60_9BILA|nr:unnamed protein product [Rotaria magnacalcarata]
MRLQQRDRQLSTMLCVQVVVYMIFTISYPINMLYNAAVLIIGGQKSAERAAIENFVLFMASSFLLNFYSAAPFSVFLMSGASRKELRQLLCKHKKNQSISSLSFFFQRGYHKLLKVAINVIWKSGDIIIKEHAFLCMRVKFIKRPKTIPLDIYVAMQLIADVILTLA